MMGCLCMDCNKYLGQREGEDGHVTHGLCRFCELKRYRAEAIATPEELAELESLELKQNDHGAFGENQD